MPLIPQQDILVVECILRNEIPGAIKDALESYPQVKIVSMQPPELIGMSSVWSVLLVVESV